MDRWLGQSSGLLKVKGAHGLQLFIYTIIAGLKPILKSNGRIYNKVTGYRKDYTDFMEHCLEQHPNFYQLKFNTQIKYLSEVLSTDINIFIRKGENLYPSRITFKFPENKPVDILKNTTEDFYLIRNINSLLRRRVGVGQNKSHLCRNCMNLFSSPRILEDHLKNCIQNITQEVNMPYPWNATLEFKSFQKIYPAQFIVYADIECSISTEGLHTPISIAFFGWNDLGIDSKPHIFLGGDCILHFLNNMIQWYEEIEAQAVIPLQMSEDDECSFNESTHCYLCNRDFSELSLNEKKVRDHNHFTGILVSRYYTV